MAIISKKAVTPTAIPAEAPEDRPLEVVEEAPPPTEVIKARLTVVVGVGVGVSEEVGEVDGATITAGTAITAFTRESEEENPKEEAMPDCWTAKVRVPSVSLLAKSASTLSCRTVALVVLLTPGRARAVEEVTVKKSCQPAKVFEES